jgi:hypothetical protein
MRKWSVTMCTFRSPSTSNAIAITPMTASTNRMERAILYGAKCRGRRGSRWLSAGGTGGSVAIRRHTTPRAARLGLLPTPIDALTRRTRARRNRAKDGLLERPDSWDQSVQAVGVDPAEGWFAVAWGRRQFVALPLNQGEPLAERSSALVCQPAPVVADGFPAT